MSGVLSNVKRLQRVEVNNNSFGSNFFMLITGFDEKNETILGYKLVSGRRPSSEEIRVRFSEYYNNLPGRPTYQSLRTNGKSKCEAGFVYFVQQASLASGVWEMRWGNIIARDIKDVYFGTSPAIVYPLVAGGSDSYQRVAILDVNEHACKSVDDIHKYIAQIALNALNKNMLSDVSVLIRLSTNRGECSSHLFSFYNNGEALDLDAALSNIENRDTFKSLINQIKNDCLFDVDGLSVSVTSVKNDLVSKVRLQKSHKVSKFYQAQNGKSFWRDSIYLYQRVFSDKEQKHYWSLQKCMPQSIACNFMPNACAKDMENFNKQTR